MKKKLVSLMLALGLCVGLTVPVTAFFDMGAAGVRNTLSAGYSLTTAISADGKLMFNSSGLWKKEIPGKVVSVSCGQNVSSAITADGSLWTWGDNRYGQLGNGTTMDPPYDENGIQAPYRLMDNVAAASCGGNHAAAIKTDGSLWMWGANYLGQLGIGSLTDSYVPVKVMDNVAAVCCGGEHTAIIKSDGSLWMCGANPWGQVGDGWNKDIIGKHKWPCRTTPVKVLDGVASVSCGWVNTAAVKTDGSLWVWGFSSGGQLGNGGKGNARTIEGYAIQTVPSKLMDNVVSVSYGHDHAAALKTDGSLWMWGSNGCGQLGNGNIGKETVPIKIMDGVADVNCGYDHTSALKTDGTVWAWGLHVYNQQGEGIYNALSAGQRRCQTVPVQIMTGAALPGSSSQPAPAPAGFADVAADSPYKDAIAWAVEKKITNGMSETTFGTDTTCTHNHILTFLWRANGAPAAEGDGDFAKAASWAGAKGLLSDGAFDGNAACTRSQTVAYLWKLAGSPAAAVSGQFSDVAADADYAQAVAWAVSQGITNGTSETTFGPDNTCTRGQIVTFLFRDLGK